MSFAKSGKRGNAGRRWFFVQRIREETKKLLKTGIKARGNPPYVYHPIYDSDIYEIEGKERNLFNQADRHYVEEMFAGRIERAETPREIMLMVTNSFRLQWLSLVRDSMSNAEFSKLLGEAWTSSPNPNAMISPEIASEWFKSANKRALMTYAEYEEYKKLASRRKLYRGGNPNGLSWTDDRERAETWGKVYVSQIPKDNIFAVFKRNYTNEYVALPKKLTLLNSKEYNSKK